jgi:ABC-type multidrug transport system ATPase subunit
MLAGLVEPAGGDIVYRGENVREYFVAFKRSIGYVPEEAHLCPQLAGREYLQLIGRLRGPVPFSTSAPAPCSICSACIRTGSRRRSLRWESKFAEK